MDRLVTVSKLEDIFPQYRDTPISLLLEYHNLNRPYDQWDSPQLLIGMCMDNRKRLLIPDNIAYILRSGGGNLRYSEFKVSYAIAVGGVRYIVLIGHSNCGMVNLYNRKQTFIDGLVGTAGWSRDKAEEHFIRFAPMFEIGNEIDFLLTESVRLRERYPKVMVAPMFYRVEDNLLYLIRE